MNFFKYFNKNTFLIILSTTIYQCAFAQNKSNETSTNPTDSTRTVAAKTTDTIAKKSIQQYTNCDKHYIYQYSKPKFLDMVRFIPNDLYKFGSFIVKKENLK